MRTRRSGRNRDVSRLLLTVPEAAGALAISRSKLYELLAVGAIASVRIDGSRRIPLSSDSTLARTLGTETICSRSTRARHWC